MIRGRGIKEEKREKRRKKESTDRGNIHGGRAHKGLHRGRTRERGR